jgi:hypothetical protein
MAVAWFSDGNTVYVFQVFSSAFLLLERCTKKYGKRTAHSSNRERTKLQRLAAADWVMAEYRG